MKKLSRILLLLLVGCFLSTEVIAQECTEVEEGALEVCLSECEAECLEPAPDCEVPVLDLVDLQEAIAEKCDCETARNYGKYRSCVNTLLKPLRGFKLITAEVKKQIKADNLACKAAIKQRRRENKQNKGKNPQE